MPRSHTLFTRPTTVRTAASCHLLILVSVTSRRVRSALIYNVLAALQLSASPSVRATGTLEAHIIPRITFGISALDGLLETDLFIELDAKAAMELDLEATLNPTFPSSSAGATPSLLPVNSGVDTLQSELSALETAGSATVQAASTATPTGTPFPSSVFSDYFAPAPAGRGMGGAAGRTLHADDYYGRDGHRSSVASLVHFARAQEVARQHARRDELDVSFGGCFDISVGLNATAGAEASAGPFSDDFTTSLFGRDFDLFKVGIPAP